VKKEIFEAVKPEKPPAGITVKKQSNEICISWKNRFNPQSITFLGTFSVLLIITLLLGTSSDEAVGALKKIFSVFTIITGFLSLLFLKGFGKNVIKISPDTICYSCAYFLQPDQMMKLSELKLIRADTNLNFFINFISTKKQIKCPMSVESSPWTKKRIECFLKEGR